MGWSESYWEDVKVDWASLHTDRREESESGAIDPSDLGAPSAEPPGDEPADPPAES